MKYFSKFVGPSHSGVDWNLITENMDKDIIGVSAPKKATFAEKERICEFLFNEEKNYWHLFTQGKQTEILLITEEDFRFATNLVGMCADRYPDVKMYTFEVMDNHIHEALSGESERCLEMFNLFRNRLQRYLQNQGRMSLLTNFQATLLPITNLNSLRNTIAYINRNGYLANSEYTPFSYPWGAGNLYFSSLYNVLDRIKKISINSLSVREKRVFCKSKDVLMSDRIKVLDNDIYIPSFCHVKEGEKFFRDAHHYFSILCRNLEANSEIAKLLGDSLSVSDEDMYYAACHLCEKHFNVKKIPLLTPHAKLEIAKMLHFDYNATNQQLRRILKLPIEEIDVLFPKER